MPGRRSEQWDARAYIPVLALPYWHLLGPFVLDVVARCEGRIDRTPEALYAAVTPMAMWVHQVRGDVLTVERVFRGATIEEFVGRGMGQYLPRSRATMRSTLWRMLEVLAPAEATRARRPIRRAMPTPPYSSAEVTGLHSWALGQATEHRRLDALALLALGLGAGLSTKELLSTVARDVASTAGGQLVLEVDGRRARQVPVLDDWRGPLSRVLTQRSNGYVFRPLRRDAAEGQVTDFLLRGRTDLDIRPARMRTTFLVHHLVAGTDPGRLLRISGLSTLASLDRLRPFCPHFGGQSGSDFREHSTSDLGFLSPGDER